MQDLTKRYLAYAGHRWQIAIHELFSLGRVRTSFIAGVLFCAIAITDFLTPPQLNLSALYVFVILLVCWNVDAVTGIVFAILSSAMQFMVFSGSMGISLDPLFRYVIIGNRVFTFFLAVGLTVPLRQLFVREQRSSRVDFLTNLFNRMALHELLSIELARNQRTNIPFSVAYIDCDNFKYVNDQLGHREGDVLLKTVAGAMKRIVRGTDVVARIGGDEFVMLLPDTGRDTAIQFTDRLRTALNKMMVTNNWPVTFSIGLGVFDRSGLGPEDILQRCDTLMYQAKTNGKNNLAWELFSGADAGANPESLRLAQSTTYEAARS